MTSQERERLQHPATGGVILFSRNYASKQQIIELIQEIRKVRISPLLIAVDQEGGRVQRFRHEFSELPPAAWYGKEYDRNDRLGRQAAELGGWLMAAELRAVGVDFSFAPVLDLDKGCSQVIGDRAFHSQPDIAGQLAMDWMRGVHAAGMAAVGKHFPGHGSVQADSHRELPVDHRTYREIEMDDLAPFERLINNGLEAIMPAHVIYANVDPELAGFSDFWLKNILRHCLRFQGVIFSDDLTMQAATHAGDYAARAKQALQAGCDMVLVCNNPEGADQVLDALSNYQEPASQIRLLRMRGKEEIGTGALRESEKWTKAMSILEAYQHETERTELDLNA